LDIKNYLASDENILAEYKGKGEHFYATDRRVIKAQKNKFLDVSYNHITSISVDEIKYKALIALGIILFIVGIILLFFSTGAGIALIVIGLILIILYFVYKKSEYVLRISDGNSISLPKTRAGNVENFVKVIRDKVR